MALTKLSSVTAAGPAARRVTSRPSPLSECGEGVKGKVRRSIKESRGEATVEFALIAVILILVTFGIVEGGRIFGSWLIITNEAREAARWGAPRVPDRAGAADVGTMVRQRTQGVLDQAELTPTATLGPNPADPQWLTVRIDYNVRLFSPPLFAFIPNPVPISAISTMRTENAAATGG